MPFLIKNMNDEVMVKLTPKGIETLRNHYLSLTMKAPDLPGSLWKGQLWECFQIFGKSCVMGCDTPIQDNQIVFIADADRISK